MHIILVRHGHVEGISPERFRGRNDLPLTPLGHAQAAATAAWIGAHRRPSAVYTSPLQRSRATAEAIAQPFGIAVRSVPELADIDYGAWQGLTPDEARTRWPAELACWESTPDRCCIPGGEMLADVLARVSRLTAELLQRHADEQIVLVGHDTVNRVLLLHALELPLAGYRRLAQSPCAINELDATASGFVLRALNLTAHLDEVA